MIAQGSTESLTLKEWPVPSHFIGAKRCRYGRTSLVGGRWVVSTVGDYRPDGGGQESIGYDRTYETMVFPLAKLCDDKLCDCGGRPVIEEWGGLDMAGYHSEAEAALGHELMVRKWEDR